jgi:chromosome segregation ATPase
MSNHDLARGTGEPLDQLVKALTDNGLDDSGKELLNNVAGNLLGRKAECDRLREQLARVQAELDEARRTAAGLADHVEKLQKEKADLVDERDQYLRSLHALIPKTPVTFTEQELDELRSNGVTFEQILADIESIKGA